MSLRKRRIAFGAALGLLPLGCRTEVEDYTAARRYCVTWSTMRISPYEVEKPTELTRWLTEEVGTGVHSPLWWSLGDNILGLQAVHHGPPPGRYWLRMHFWYFYLAADEQEKKQIVATARRYFGASDRAARAAISAEAFEKRGRLIMHSPASPHTALPSTQPASSR